MTQKRLDDLMQMSNDKTLTISDLGEICGALLESSSRHSKDLKIKINHFDPFNFLDYLDKKCTQ